MQYILYTTLQVQYVDSKMELLTALISSEGFWSVQCPCEQPATPLQASVNSQQTLEGWRGPLEAGETRNGYQHLQFKCTAYEY